MQKEYMRCQNCIFLNREDTDIYCHLKPHIITESEERVLIDFPVIYASELWCGQGEWEGAAKDNPEVKILYRWGEWDN